MTDIKGKVAVVTGAGSGMGRALALALAVEGASVVVADIIKDNAEAVAKEIGKAGGTARAIMCDVCERASVNKLKDEANRAFGPVSLLFANAGVSDLQRFTDMSDIELDWVIQVDLMGVSHCMKAFLPDMIVAKSGHVMATASTAGMMPASIPFLSSYAMAKAGVLGLMLCLRVELATVGVGCTVLCPGQVATQIQHSARNRPERFGGPGTQAMNLRPDDVALFRKLHKEIKTRTPEEVAQMVLTAVRKDRPMVLTDPAMRQIFQESYVDVVMSAFDDAEAFDKANI